MRPFAPLGIAALMLVSSSARAQSDEAKAQAVQRYVEGNALHSAGKDEDAYVRFAQAYAVIQTPPVIFDLARMEQTTGRLLESARHYREYLAHPPHPKMTAEMRAKASAFLSEVNSKLGHLVIEAPSGAVITVDGKVLAPKDVPDVLAGEHTVAVQFGDQSGSVRVVAAAGVETRVRVPLEGSKTGSAPLALPAAVAPVIALPPVDADRGNNTARNVTGAVVLSLSAVSFGLAAGFGADRGSKSSDAASLRSGPGSSSSACSGSANASSSCQQLASLRSAHDSDVGTETGFLVAGSILAVAGAAVFALWHPAPRKTAVTWFAPSISRGGASVDFGLRF